MGTRKMASRNQGGEWFTHAGQRHTGDRAERTYFPEPVPEEINFEGHRLTLWTYDQLHRAPHKILRQRAADLREAVGASRLPPFSPAMDVEAMTRWVLEVEVALANAVTGGAFTFFDFGVPEDYPLQAPSFGSAPTQKSRAYQGLQNASPFAADYSVDNAEYKPNSKIVSQNIREPENIPPWGRSTTETRSAFTSGSGAFGGGSGAFGGGGVIASMMQAHADAMTGAEAARRRNQVGHGIF